MMTLDLDSIAGMDPKGIIRVQIIQPLIPAYRVALFRWVAKCSDLQVKVCASKTVPGIENLSSVDIEEELADLKHPCHAFFRNRFLWQNNLHLDPDMGKGDVLVLCGNLRFLSNIPLILNAKIRGVSLVWWGHGFSKRRNLFKDLINRIVIHFVHVRLFYTDKEVEEHKLMGLPENKLFATNNAIDQDPIRKAKAAWGNKKLLEFQRIENIDGKHILLFCGRRTKSVSLELVFAALAQLRETDDKYIFAIIGPDEGEGFLAQKAREFGVEDCIRWLGPMFDQHELAPWFMSARCLVNPGAIGLTIIHSFSYGLPVVVPDCVHGPEIAALSDEENGLFYIDGNVNDLVKKISALIYNPAYQKNMSANALKTAEKDYNMANMVNRFVGAIRAASQQIVNTL